MNAPGRALGLVGTGAVAHALARALAGCGGGGGAGQPVVVWGRSPGAAEAVAAAGGALARRAGTLAELTAAVDCVVLAVSDSAIGDVARAVADASGGRSLTLLHTSGASTGADAMASAARAGLSLGSIHPLVAVRRDTASFAGHVFATEGSDERSRGAARALVELLGGSSLAIPEGAEQKRRYHALATMVATGVVALVERASRELALDGADREAARRAFAQLAASAARNVEAAPLEQALTGAVARGDDALVEVHLGALRARAAEAAYRAMVGEARALLGEAAPPA